MVLLMSLSEVCWPSTCPLLQIKVKPANTAALSRLILRTNRRNSGIWLKVTCLSQRVFALSLSVANHLHEILDQLIRALSRGTRLANGCQFFPFGLIQLLWIAHKQPDRLVCVKILQRPWGNVPWLWPSRVSALLKSDRSSWMIPCSLALATPHRDEGRCVVLAATA